MSLEMDGIGGFILYGADGTVEESGYLDYVDEYGDGNLRYDLYNGEDQWIGGFWFDGEDWFHMGNGGEEQ